MHTSPENKNTSPESLPVPITDATFDNAVEQANEAGKVALVDFWAEWCPPCKQIAPVLEELASEFSDDLAVLKLDVDANAAKPMEFGVLSIPTLLVFKDGVPVDRIVGFQSKARLAQRLQGHFSTATDTI